LEFLDLLAPYRRVFLIKASTAATAPTFTAVSLASQGGRMDLVVRAVISAIATPEGPRRDTAIVSVLEGPPKPPLALVALGSEIRELPLSEGELGRVIIELLSGKSVRGFATLRVSFQALVARIVEAVGKDCVVYLHELGVPAERDPGFRSAKFFILGDHLGLDRRTEDFLDGLGIRRINLGPLSYLTSHCITVVHELLDRLP